MERSICFVRLNENCFFVHRYKRTCRIEIESEVYSGGMCGGVGVGGRGGGKRLAGIRCVEEV